MIQFVDLDAQYHTIKDEVAEAINKILVEKDFINGRSVKKFMSNFSNAHNVKYGVGCANGTSAITVALRALGVCPGDEVITVANSFFATAEAIVEVGATPVFVDCDINTYTICVNSIEKNITDKTKAIIPVHLYGNPADMAAIVKLAKTHNLKVIEDCAQAHLARVEDRYVSSWGDIGTFSFYPGKNLGAYGDAGALLTNNEDLNKLIGMHVDHGRTDKYLHEFCAGNFRMDGIQAAILDVKLKYLKEWTEKRKLIAKKYNSLIKDKGFKVLEENNNSECVYHLFPIEVSNREEVMERLREKGISVGVHYPIPLHLQPAIQKINPKKLSLKNCEQISSRQMSIPIYPELSDDQISYIADTFLRVAKV